MRDLIPPVKRVMVLCTGNSCRSQMAEGLLRQMGGGRIEAHSAGIMAAGVHPRAVAVMRELGIDISTQTSKEMDPDLINRMDVVITVCGNAEATCPTTPPGVRRIHLPVDDPVGATGTEEEIMSQFRRARDELRAKLAPLVKEILSEESP